MMLDTQGALQKSNSRSTHPATGVPLAKSKRQKINTPITDTAIFLFAVVCSDNPLRNDRLQDYEPHPFTGWLSGCLLEHSAEMWRTR